MQQQCLHTPANRGHGFLKPIAAHTRVRGLPVLPFTCQVRGQKRGYHGAQSFAAPAWVPVRQFRSQPAAFVCRSSLVPESIPSDVKLELDPDTAAKEVTYDEPSKTIKIPLAAINDGQRRTKMVMFTCNQCGGRSARLVNPVAWEKGAVFCQCQHCGVWHTLRAAKHIMEEVRYNDPDWQLEGQQASTTAMAAAADIDGSQQAFGSQDSADTELELPSADDLEVTSAANTADQQQPAAVEQQQGNSS